MNKSARILASIGTGIAFIGLSACGGGGGDTSSPEYQAFVERDAFMNELGEAVRVINDMAAEEIPVDEAAFRQAVDTVATQAPLLVSHFENQTIVEESRTEPEVFSNWADFTAKNDALVTAANALRTATASGGFAAGRPLIRAMVDTCGSCHRAYRGPEKE